MTFHRTIPRPQELWRDASILAILKTKQQRSVQWSRAAPKNLMVILVFRAYSMSLGRDCHFHWFACHFFDFCMSVCQSSFNFNSIFNWHFQIIKISTLAVICFNVSDKIISLSLICISSQPQPVKCSMSSLNF